MWIPRGNRKVNLKKETPYRVGGVFFESAWCLEEGIFPLLDIANPAEADFFDPRCYQLEPIMVESFNGICLSTLAGFHLNDNLTICPA
jgi:hypothetical protein